MLKNEGFVKNMAKHIGEVQELQIALPSGFVGQFIRVRLKLNVEQKLTWFVSFTRAGKTEYYQVKHEKLPTFCRACGKLGHWHQECGTGEHDEDKFEWGPFILAPRRGRGGTRGSGRGFGRGHGGGRGDERFSARGGRGGFDRGEHGGNNSARELLEITDPSISWRWNSLHTHHGNGSEEEAVVTEKDGATDTVMAKTYQTT